MWNRFPIVFWEPHWQEMSNAPESCYSNKAGCPRHCGRCPKHPSDLHCPNWQWDCFTASHLFQQFLLTNYADLHWASVRWIINDIKRKPLRSIRGWPPLWFQDKLSEQHHRLRYGQSELHRPELRGIWVGWRRTAILSLRMGRHCQYDWVQHGIARGPLTPAQTWTEYLPLRNRNPWKSRSSTHDLYGNQPDRDGCLPDILQFDRVHRRKLLDRLGHEQELPRYCPLCGRVCPVSFDRADAQSNHDARSTLHLRVTTRSEHSSLFGRGPWTGYLINSCSAVETGRSTYVD